MKVDYDNWSICGDGECTNIAFGTAAQRAVDLYDAKQKLISDLKFECKLLVEKYHAEMKRADIPAWFRKDILWDMFSDDAKKRKFTREGFLEKGFSKDFPKKHKVNFVSAYHVGLSGASAGVRLEIGDYEYGIEFPQPMNVVRDEDKERFFGELKFRVDRIHKSKKDEFIKEMEPVQMPTYDWKACFEAIEKIVESGKKDEKNEKAKKG